jgi:fructose-bisphosphate aldolase class II
MALGAQVLAEAAHRLAERYGVLIALHTDHCHPKNLKPFVDPLIEVSEARVARGERPLFNSHMFDGSELSLDENLAISKRYLERLAPIEMILEIETGVVGGEEDGHDTSGTASEKLYTTPEEMVSAFETLQPIGRFLLAATFGNVHGVYKPGNVKLRPEILKNSQALVKEQRSTDANPLNLVFHGGSGSEKEKIHEAVGYGVFKMNIDTDTQFAFSSPLKDYIDENGKAFQYQIDPDDGTPYKKLYDPRKWQRACEEGMGARLIEAFEDLGSKGRSIAKR